MNNTTILWSAQLGISLTYITIELFGLCGNILVIFSICSSRRLNTNYYFLVFHVAICDIVMVLLGNLLFSLLLRDMSYSTFTTLQMISCIVTLPMSQSIYLCESLFLVIIALLRYKAVNDPLRPHLSRKKLTYIVASVYIIAFIVHVPIFVLDEAKVFACRSTGDQSISIKIYNNIFESIVTLLPFTVLAVLYFKMCRSLLQHNKKVKQLFYSRVTTGEEEKTNTALARNYKTLITSFVIVVQLFISVLPARIIHMLTLAEIKENDYHAMWSMMLYFLGVCTLNPVIYGLGDKTLRASYVKCFKKLFMKNRL